MKGFRRWSDEVRRASIEMRVWTSIRIIGDVRE